MIDEYATLLGLVRELRKELEGWRAGRRDPDLCLTAMFETFNEHRDNPVRCEGGGSTKLSQESIFDKTPEERDAFIQAFLNTRQPTQAERDAAQEAEWRKLFEPSEPSERTEECCALGVFTIESERESGSTVREESWIAAVRQMPGVLAYGSTREAAIRAVKVLALRALADKIEHGE